MGFLTVRTVVDVDIGCLLLFHPNTAETGGDRHQYAPGQPPSAPSIHKLRASSCSLLETEARGAVWDCGPWGRRGERLQSRPPQAQICSGIHMQLQLQLLAMGTQRCATHQASLPR